MKNIKPFGPSIGKTKISKKFSDKLNNEFDSKSNSKKIDYSSKLASQIKKEIGVSPGMVIKTLVDEMKVELLDKAFNKYKCDYGTGL